MDIKDEMVSKTQEWLNLNYTGKAGYTPITVTGITGWTTIYALLHALQIELGITDTADNFGEGTTNRFKEKYPYGIQQQEDSSEKEENIYGIIQGALWCKGYSTGASMITKHFYSGTGNAIENLKKDAGLENVDSIVTLNVMKALMSMDQFKLVNGGNYHIQIVQQRLNNKYEEYIGLCPCDGLYGRQMNKSLIIVLQAIEGFSIDEATGNFASGTISRLPMLPDTAGILTDKTVKEATDLIKYALICNGYYSVDLETYTWDTFLMTNIKSFQKEMAISQTGTADIDTWMALLLSRGNPTRACIACDTSYDFLSESRRKFLKDNGYEIIGRYINGTSQVKEFEPGELKILLEDGFKYFPIYQRNGTPSIAKFTEKMAHEDALEASKGIVRNGIPRGAIVYFAVDFDAQDTDIINYIIPYFRIIANEFDSSCKVGIYATRNVCTQIMKDNSSVVTCFVSDMSTGYSGNMGFKMPEKWNLDQFYELRYKTAIEDRVDVNYPSDFDLDRVAYSGRFPVESTAEFYIAPEKTSTSNKKSIKWFVENCIKMIEKYAVKYLSEIKGNSLYSSKEVAILVLNALRYYKYNTSQWKAVLGDIDIEFMEYFTRKYYDDEDKIFTLEFGHYLSDDSNDYLITGENDSVIDIAHLAATTQAYYTTIFPKFWSGWGGDLATAMAQIQKVVNEGETLSIKEIADQIVCSGVMPSNFNYADLCCDADAIKISELISNTNNLNNPISASIEEYYSNYSEKRYQFLVDDIVPLRVASYDLYSKIHYLMTKILIDGINIITFKGGNAQDSVVTSCCEAFANYIMSMI